MCDAHGALFCFHLCSFVRLFVCLSERTPTNTFFTFSYPHKSTNVVTDIVFYGCDVKQNVLSQYSADGALVDDDAPQTGALAPVDGDRDPRQRRLMPPPPPYPLSDSARHFVEPRPSDGMDTPVSLEREYPRWITDDGLGNLSLARGPRETIPYRDRLEACLDRYQNDSELRHRTVELNGLRKAFNRVRVLIQGCIVMTPDELRAHNDNRDARVAREVQAATDSA